MWHRGAPGHAYTRISALWTTAWWWGGLLPEPIARGLLLVLSLAFVVDGMRTRQRLSVIVGLFLTLPALRGPMLLRGLAPHWGEPLFWRVCGLSLLGYVALMLSFVPWKRVLRARRSGRAV